MKKAIGPKFYSKSVPKDQSADIDLDVDTSPEKSPEYVYNAFEF
jgi:hypothetical protein